MVPVFQVIYRCYRLISSVRYWVLRRFPGAGRVALGATVVTAVMAVDTENTVAYQAFALLLFLLVIAMASAPLFRARFIATRLLERFGTVGQPFHYTVRISNLSADTEQGLTLLEDLTDTRPAFPEWLALQRASQTHFRSFRFSQRRRANPFKCARLSEGVVPPLRPRQTVEVRLQLTPLRRGLLRFAGVTLARPDPLGLFRAFSKVPAPQAALILPKRYPLPALALPGTVKYQQGGVALASSIGQSEEFVALRDYRPGDPLRHIHWRSWAKAGQPVVKEFEDEFFVRHALVLDTFSEQLLAEAFEEAVSVAASFACTIQTQESLLDLLFVGPQSYCFTAGRGLAHVDQMLEILASVRPCTDKPFRVLEHLVLNHVRLVSGCICVLLGWDLERRQFIEKLEALALPVLVLVIVEAGGSQTIRPRPMAKTPEHFQVLEVGQIEAGLAKLR